MVSDGAGNSGRKRLTRKREYDEDDVRIRPGRSSRPRTRQRPKHSDALTGFVIAVDRGRYTVWLPDQERSVTTMRARELGRHGVVVGDRVHIVGDTTGDAGTLARIVRIEERDSTLTRTADDVEGSVEGRQERVVVANADQMVIVSALADPPPRTGFIDRCLVAAYDAEIDPLLCLTKADLAGPEALLDYYTDLDLPYVLCRPDRPLDLLLAELSGRLSVLVGHSGVGKSTLVNRLVPDADRAVGVVSAVGKGRHTSTSAVALRLPDDVGWIVDTPGVRSFGLAHVTENSILHGFPDLVEASTRCPPNCDHTGAGGECGLDMLVAEGGADPRRLASYRRLLALKAGDDPNRFREDIGAGENDPGEQTHG
ncbi:ribosome small subunit-dependent GTPase A [Virgisporangium ochraceum]|uniref:Small ribosomal subunit biogenesis GTPase RsgA n=1 Tax=Virgisporangium ochraceum TaxID=65505 RepID=A0A8J3ZZ83_9ACTN|nr:ribosome small subunit-dependent GTPase A [Virgisporangium ochraceum]GIJ70190.1 putative ribosome biogenesis GTPase RsgA [Virgisporangium ochraceum]